MKSYTTGAKRYWMAWSVKHKKKRKFTSQPSSEERSTYFTFSEIQITPKEDMAVNSLFLIIKAKLSARALHHPREREKMNTKFVMHRIKFTLVQACFSITRDHENDFLHNKNISWNQRHFACSTESFRFRNENYVYKILVLAYSEPATDYVLIEGRIAFYRHCSLRNSILWSFLKISFPPMGICIWSDFWLQNCARPVVKYIIPWWQRNSVEKQETKYYWSFALPLSCENWFKSCEHRHWWLNHKFKSFGSEKGGLILMIISWWWWW